MTIAYFIDLLLLVLTQESSKKIKVELMNLMRAKKILNLSFASFENLKTKFEIIIEKKNT